MNEKWTNIIIDVETITESGDPLYLSGVKALQHVGTKEIGIHPHEISQAEIRALAKKNGLKEARDISTFLIMFARPGEGMFKEGDVLYKYSLQKILFYLWKFLDDDGLPDVMPRDEFIAAQHGPMPVNLDDDLKRFINDGLVESTLKYWHPEYPDGTKYISLTDKGIRLAKEIWVDSPSEYSEMALRAKTKIYPLTPQQLMHMVHSKYPEYIDETVNDIE